MYNKHWKKDRGKPGDQPSTIQGRHALCRPCCCTPSAVGKLKRHPSQLVDASTWSSPCTTGRSFRTCSPGCSHTRPSQPTHGTDSLQQGDRELQQFRRQVAKLRRGLLRACVTHLCRGRGPAAPASRTPPQTPSSELPPASAPAAEMAAKRWGTMVCQQSRARVVLPSQAAVQLHSAAEQG